MSVTAPSGETSPERDYLEAVLDLLEEHALNRERMDWARVRREAEAQIADATATEQAYGVIDAVLDLLGDPHTFFLRPQDAGEARDQEEAPAGPVPTGRLIDGGFAHLTVPEADGGTEAERRCIREGAAAVRDLDRHRPKGWVVDLRGNTGGSMYPMLTVLAPLLGHGHLGSFVDAAGEVSGRWLLRDGVVYVDDEALSATPYPYLPAEPEPPVAVLIDGRTMSAGEATLIAFLGMPRVGPSGRPLPGWRPGTSPSTWPMAPFSFSQWPARPTGPAASTATLPWPRTSPRRGMPTRSPTLWRGYGPFGPRPQGGAG
ncbi:MULTISPECIES: S41 family peptidase [unclassified Streptomyces]|uniref:S41 family peptidase n=1 Tax=unclassified Streptomyces TaxID=2593676 RepID=UPI00136EAD20|nr:MULTISPECIES: S41 family peptidase [unclassified Streptomyces]MYT11859.1 peptidase S41 [Streptomyces sp. SID4951]